MDFFDMMRQASATTTIEKISRSEGLKLLGRFMEARVNDIKEGDFVERNELGRARMKFPDDNQVAICIKRLPESLLDKDDDYVDMIIAVALGKDTVKTFPASSAFYKRAEEKKNIIGLFSRK